MFQRIIAGIFALLAFAPMAAHSWSDRSQLVWEGPEDVSPENTAASASSAPAAAARPSRQARPFAPQESNFRASGLRVSNQIITNNFGDQYSFSGGPDLMHGNNAPAGFNDNSQAAMPLLTQGMVEDDGGAALAVTQSDRRAPAANRDVMVSDAVVDGGTRVMSADDMAEDFDAAADAGSGADVVKSWVVMSGKTLREVLGEWAENAGWDLVWNTSREYPISASAVFEGRFMDVSSALVRNFARATPVPHARFYKGNKVLVISTLEDGDSNAY